MEENNPPYLMRRKKLGRFAQDTIDFAETWSQCATTGKKVLADELYFTMELL